MALRDVNDPVGNMAEEGGDLICYFLSHASGWVLVDCHWVVVWDL